MSEISITSMRNKDANDNKIKEIKGEVEGLKKELGKISKDNIILEGQLKSKTDELELTIKGKKELSNYAEERIEELEALTKKGTSERDFQRLVEKDKRIAELEAYKKMWGEFKGLAIECDEDIILNNSLDVKQRKEIKHIRRKLEEIEDKYLPKEQDDCDKCSVCARDMFPASKMNCKIQEQEKGKEYEPDNWDDIQNAQLNSPIDKMQSEDSLKCCPKCKGFKGWENRIGGWTECPLCKEDKKE